MLIPLGGCGKEEKDNNSSVSTMEQLSPEKLKNLVYREEELSFLEGKDYTDIVVSGDKNIYAVRCEYAEGEVVPLAKDIEETAENADTEVAQEVIAEEPTAEEPTEEEPIAEEPMPEDLEGTFEFFIDCYELASGKLIGSYDCQYPGNSSIWLYRGDDKGNIYYMYDTYSYDDLSGAFSDT